MTNSHGGCSASEQVILNERPDLPRLRLYGLERLHRSDGFPCCWVEDDLCSACAFFAQGDRVVVLEEASHFTGKEDSS